MSDEWSDDEDHVPSMGGGGFVLPTPKGGAASALAPAPAAPVAASAPLPAAVAPVEDEKPTQHVFLCLPVQLFLTGTMNQGILIPTAAASRTLPRFGVAYGAVLTCSVAWFAAAPVVAGATLLHDTGKKLWTVMFYDTAKR